MSIDIYLVLYRTSLPGCKWLNRRRVGRDFLAGDSNEARLRKLVGSWVGSRGSGSTVVWGRDWRLFTREEAFVLRSFTYPHRVGSA